MSKIKLQCDTCQKVIFRFPSETKSQKIFCCIQCKNDYPLSLHVDEIHSFLKIKQVVKQKVPGKRDKYVAICDCLLCGKTNFSTLLHSIKSGRTTSCGCRRDQYDKMRGENSNLFTGYKDITGKFWGQVKLRAERRKLDFDLNIKYCWDLYLKQNKRCALSDISIQFGRSNKETTASIDRLDIKKGYEQGNIQLVHKHINIMRNIYSIEHFIDMCKRVAKFNE